MRAMGYPTPTPFHGSSYPALKSLDMSMPFQRALQRFAAPLACYTLRSVKILENENNSHEDEVLLITLTAKHSPLLESLTIELLHHLLRLFTSLPRLHCLDFGVAEGTPPRKDAVYLPSNTLAYIAALAPPLTALTIFMSFAVNEHEVGPSPSVSNPRYSLLRP
ncbi:hypothetical protein ONZ45_g18458 [Pleurotus djamor]|nr:hypothetical protein ONZ45_g18458 [Pleurotus djamor]